MCVGGGGLLRGVCIPSVFFNEARIQLQHICMEPSCCVDGFKKQYVYRYGAACAQHLARLCKVPSMRPDNVR